MKLELFRPEDFKQPSKLGVSCQEASQVANQKLNEYIDTLPKVYGVDDEKWGFSHKKIDEDTHQARLICLEPIEKKECDHEAVRVDLYGNLNAINYGGTFTKKAFLYECQHCGKKLKAKWEVDE